MSANIQAKADMSWLFSSLGSGAAGVAGSNFLSDYAAIKNGSYMKLMKAYYGSSANDSVKSVVDNNANRRTNSSHALTKEENKAYNKVKSTTDALKESADSMLVTGSKSVFQLKDITVKDENGVESTEKGYDTEAIYKAVNGFVNNYNAVISAVDKTDNGNVNRRALNMLNETTSNLKSLLAAGISINADGTLALDKETFMEADMNKVKNLFNGNGSYAYRVSAQASMLNYAAENVLSKAGTYTAAGKYGANYNSGNMFNSWL